MMSYDSLSFPWDTGLTWLTRFLTPDIGSEALRECSTPWAGQAHILVNYTQPCPKDDRKWAPPLRCACVYLGRGEGAMPAPYPCRQELLLPFKSIMKPACHLSPRKSITFNLGNCLLIEQTTVSMGLIYSYRNPLIWMTSGHWGSEDKIKTHI